eukprot:4431242-Lingulodinium_polyedra.AAC.1
MSLPAPPKIGAGAMVGAFGPMLSRVPFWDCSPRRMAMGAIVPLSAFAALNVRGGGARRLSR